MGAKIPIPEVLENPVRQRIYKAIRKFPGIYRLELINLTGFSTSCVVEHTNLLEGRNYVVREKLRPHPMGFFEVGRYPPEERRAIMREKALDRARKNLGLEVLDVAKVGSVK